MKKVVLFCGCLLFTLLSCPNQVLVPDIIILYNEDIFEKSGFKLIQVNIQLENGGQLSWQPGKKKEYYDVLEYGDKSITVSCTAKRYCGEDEDEDEEVTKIIKVYKSPLHPESNLVDTELLFFSNKVKKRISLNTKTHYGAELKSVEIRIPEYGNCISRQWQPDNYESEWESESESKFFFDLYLEDKVYEVRVTWEAATYMTPQYIVEGEYRIQPGDTVIEIDAGPFTNSFIYQDDNKDFHIIKDIHGFSLDTYTDTSESYTISIPEGEEETTFGLYFRHNYDIIIYLNGKYWIYKRNPDGTYGSPDPIQGWPAEYVMNFSGDFDGEDPEDLFLVRRIQDPVTNRSEYEYMIARGQEDNCFDFTGPVILFIDYAWVASYTIADINNDKKYDLIYFFSGGGGYFSTVVCVLKGIGDGTLEQEPTELFTADDHSASSISVGDVNNDGLMDILLGVDDDTPDMGQLVLYINKSRNDEELIFEKVEEFIDYLPLIEPDTAFIVPDPPFISSILPDKFEVFTQFSDFNLDGWLDIVAKERLIPDNVYKYSIHLNDGTGNYSPYGDDGQDLIPYTNWNSAYSYAWSLKPYY